MGLHDIEKKLEVSREMKKKGTELLMEDLGKMITSLKELRGELKKFEKKFGSAEEEEISDWELAIKQTGIKPKEKAIRTGLLFTAGLVAGEALMGVVIAILVVMGINLPIFDNAPWLPGLLIWLYIAVLLAYIPIREVINNKTR